MLSFCNRLYCKLMTFVAYIKKPTTCKNMKTGISVAKYGINMQSNYFLIEEIF